MSPRPRQFTGPQTAWPQPPSPQFTPARAGRPATRIAFYWASVLLFVHFGRLFDSFLKGYRIPAAICGAAIVVMLFAGGLVQLRSRIGMAFVAMVAWMAVSVPLSYWPGGSAAYVLWFAEFFLPMMTLLALAVEVPGDVVKLSAVLTLSCFFHLILNSNEQGGRAGLSGTFGNPDDVALLAGFNIPLVILVTSRIKASLIRYCLLVPAVCYLLLTIGRTATRAAIPALIAMLGVYFFRSAGRAKLAVAVFAALLPLAAVFVLPESAVERLATVLDAVAGPSKAVPTARMTEAEASALERHELMRDGITMALTHPLAGVGAGLFTQYRRDKMLRADGSPKPYLPTHNTYLEIASECGIPGVVFYLVFLWSIFATIYATRKAAIAKPASDSGLVLSIALCLEATLVYFAVCAMFMTCDQHPHQFALAGLTLGIFNVMRARTTVAPAPYVKPAPYNVRAVGRQAWPVTAP